MLQPSHSRQRQRRLLEVMIDRKLDAIVVGARHHVYYLSAMLTSWLHESAFVLFADGRSWLAAPNQAPSSSAADEVVTFEANWVSTLRQEQPMVVAGKVITALSKHHVGRIGVDASAVTSQVGLDVDAEAEPIDEDLWQLRRRKDPDELDLIRRAIACTEAMYARAKEIIEPGVPELKVFSELQAAAVETAGEPLSALLGNDYACGVPGGPPRAGRTAQAGELYILDLGPAYRGYFADNCRAFAVDGKPTDAQLKTYEALSSALALVERLARPGARCQDIYEAVTEHIHAELGVHMTHHLGHGIGLQPHEYPHLNPRWDDTLIEGEIFTAEPGIYGPELRGGIRLENDYLVTSGGVENLVKVPLGLI